MFPYLSPFDFEFVVHAGCEVVQDNHLGLWAQPVLLLDAHADQCLDGGAAGDATHGGNRTLKRLIVES